MTDVILDSSETDLEFRGDLLIAQPSCDGRSDAFFSLCQVLVAERPIIRGSADQTRDFRVGAFDALQNIGYDGEEFIGLERFGEVGIYSRPKAGDAVSRFVLGRKKDDRNKICTRTAA